IKSMTYVCFGVGLDRNLTVSPPVPTDGRKGPSGPRASRYWMPRRAERVDVSTPSARIKRVAAHRYGREKAPAALTTGALMPLTRRASRTYVKRLSGLLRMQKHRMLRHK